MSRTKTDELKFDTFASFPTEWSEGILYIATDTDIIYYWNWSAYVATWGGSWGAAWWAITWTLSDQTDLQTELDAKVDLAWDTMTGKLIWVTPTTWTATYNLPNWVDPTTPATWDFWFNWTNLYFNDWTTDNDLLAWWWGWGWLWTELADVTLGTDWNELSSWTITSYDRYKVYVTCTSTGITYPWIRVNSITINYTHDNFFWVNEWSNANTTNCIMVYNYWQADSIFNYEIDISNDNWVRKWMRYTLLSNKTNTHREEWGYWHSPELSLITEIKLYTHSWTFSSWARMKVYWMNL